MVENRPPEQTVRAEWDRRYAGAGILVIAACVVALYLFLLGFPLAALVVGLAAVLLGASLALAVAGSSVEPTEAQLLLRSGFIPYSFPWSDIRGFVIDRRSPSEVYVAALHPHHRALALFEIPAVRTPSSLALAARLNGEVKRHQRHQ